jgi:hypothetical protein
VRVHFGVDVLKPEDKEFFDRIALCLVVERGFGKSLRIVLAHVYKDKRVLQIEETFSIRNLIPCLHSVIVKRFVGHLDQRLVHPVLSL